VTFKNNATFDEASSDLKQFVANLRGQLINAIKNGASTKEIAAQAFVCEGTVKRFADGKTAQPSPFTQKYIARALGYRLALLPIDTPKQPGEIS
jgi:hypothetical protein